MKKVYLLFFMFQVSFCAAQSGFELESSFGYAFQAQLNFAGEEVQDRGALGLRTGINYRRFVGKKIFIESGVHAKYLKANRRINLISFSSHNLSFQLPFYLGTSLSDKWDFSIGMGIENNFTFQGISTDDGKIFRHDLLFKLSYNLKGPVKVLFYTNWMIGENYASYNIPNPRNGMYLGVVYPIKQ